MPVETGADLVRTGSGPALAGRPVALLCHPASVDARLTHLRDVVGARGAEIRSLLGPEHGLDATAQDMEALPVGAARRADVPERGPPVYELYGDDFDSLVPRPAMFHGADLLLCDLQDVGARYYTYVWSIVLAAEVALNAGLECVVLDRPNPLGGTVIEGGVVGPEMDSFVGLHDVAVRHAMTIGELVTLALTERARAPLSRFSVVEMRGWRRSMDFGDTGLPWVLPSPNMPTLDTAWIYPGQCLIEGTNLSEGRGTTRPFELFGAPWIDARAWAEALARWAPGLALRPVAFKPVHQKFAGQVCRGLQLHVRARAQVRSLETSIAALATCRALFGDALRWRTERYEFVDHIPAIDLLAGGAWLREGVDAAAPIAELVDRGTRPDPEFLRRREEFLRYRDL